MKSLFRANFTVSVWSLICFKDHLNSYKSLMMCLLIAAGVTGFKSASGQGSSQYLTPPNVIPPSPDAQSFMKYGAYQVDYSTGVPTIEVPLYEVKSRSLTLPISLSYHASGIPVNEISGVVGLGWKLNAGGVFTRTVKSKADETSNGFLSIGYRTKSQIDNAQSSQAYYDLEAVSKGQIDSESDNYFYATSDGLSTQFVYDNLKNIVPTLYSSDKIIKHPITLSQVGSTYNLEVIKDDGTSYTFDQQELTLNDGIWYPSSWWLSKIVSADKTDSITFEYQKYPTQYRDYGISETWTYGLYGYAGMASFARSSTPTMSFSTLLTRINFANGYVKFDYSNDRLDMRDSRLTTVSIYDNADVLQKQFQLVQSYFYSGFANNKFNYRLKLDKVNVLDGKRHFVNNYTLNYNDHTALPPYFNMQDINPNACFAVDFWGYYNGQVTNETWVPYLPSLTDNPALNPWLPMPRASANRTPDETSMKACVLNAITYPTGGYSLFEYQSNVNSSGDQLVGGLRIHRIISQADKDAAPVIKRYEYNYNMIGNGRIMDAQKRYNYTQMNFYFDSNCDMGNENLTIYMDNPVVPLLSHNGSPAIYQSVDEYADGENGSFKTTYTYEYESDIVYDVQFPRYQNEYFVDRSWRYGQLSTTTHYKMVNGTYNPIQWTSNMYGDYRTNTVIEGTKVQQKVTVPVSSTCSNDNGSGTFLDVYNGEPFLAYFYYFDVTISVGIRKLTKQTIVDYDNNGNGHTTIKNYSYESPYHLFPTKIELINSMGARRVTLQKYPHDFAGTAVYDAMISSNRISLVVQQLEYKDNTFLQSTKINYKDWGNGVIAPETVETQVGTNASETRLHYYAYDNTGNLLTVAKENDPQVTYLWGYNQTYPIAKFDNTSYSSVSSNTSLLNYVNQLQTYTDLTDPVVRTNLKTLNTNIRSNVPANVRVTTYTYKPLVGLTSQTDQNGVSSYFEHDDFGRLSLVKNLDGDVVKQFNYNFRKQANYEFYFNAQTYEASGTFARNNCPAGYEGAFASYIVPYGKYSSIISQQDADQKAQSDVTANGQAYVNAHADCLLSSLVYLNYHNWTTMTFSITYLNSSTGAIYTFTLKPSTNVSFGTIPKGTYNVTITPSTGSELYDMSVYNYSVFGIMSLTKTGLSLDCSNCGHVEIDTH